MALMSRKKMLETRQKCLNDPDFLIQQFNNFCKSSDYPNVTAFCSKYACVSYSTFKNIQNQCQEDEIIEIFNAIKLDLAIDKEKSLFDKDTFQGSKYWLDGVLKFSSDDQEENTLMPVPSTIHYHLHNDEE